MRAAVFLSGSGTNLEALLEKQEEGKLAAQIVCVISDKEEAYGLQRARSHGLPAYFVPAKGRPKPEYEADVLDILQKEQVEVVLLAGYMRFIGSTLLEAYPQAILNIHPALLPQFPGAHGIQDAYETKAERTGVTIHLVDEGVDTGPILAQEGFAVDPDWSLEELEQKVHETEYGLYWKAVNAFVKEREGIE